MAVQIRCSPHCRELLYLIVYFIILESETKNGGGGAAMPYMFSTILTLKFKHKVWLLSQVMPGVAIVYATFEIVKRSFHVDHYNAGQR